MRRPGEGGPPEPILTQTPHRWSIWVASSADGSARMVWRSPDTLAGSYPEVEGEANLHWAAADHLVFLAYLDDWPHLYSVPAAGGTPTLLTPGAFMVEHVAESRDLRFMIYDANTGTTAGDDDRRHLFRVPVDQPTSIALTSGETLEWTPVSAAGDRVAFVEAGAQQPPAIARVDLDGAHRTVLGAGTPAADFPLSQLVVPRRVTFRAADGTLVHGQLFERREAAPAAKPGLIFVHGGPPRQMLLGWHYMEYYSNAYAVNQYLAAHGFVVLSVNYRLASATAAPSISPSTQASRVPRNIRTSWRAPTSCNRSPPSMPGASAFGAARTAAISPLWRSLAIRMCSRPESICTAYTTGHG